MRKEVLVILELIILLGFLCNTLAPSGITGETVTGEATNANLAISVSVIGAPSLSIITPKNGTYITSKNLLFNYSARSADNVWYNFDGAGNITLTTPFYFNTTEGNHTIFLYANNSYGESSANVSFTVNTNKFRIIYNEYADSLRGESTNFNQTTYEEMQNLSDIILENTDSGKIKFTEAINITDDENPADNATNIDNYINISYNRIEINSTALPNFNKSATLYFYNLNFSNPRVLIDGVVCPSTICTDSVYSGGILTVNVTHFTVYSTEENPETPSTSSGGGGGTQTYDFYAEPSQIFISLKQGETDSENITITNKENRKLQIYLEESGLNSLIRLDETEFYINAKESKEITLDFIATEETTPDIYIGKIIATAGGISKEILISMEIETKSPLFDIEVNIPEQLQTISPEENIYAEIQLYNLGHYDRVDVILDYIIKDSDGNEILSETETVAVETQMSSIKEINLPEDLEDGQYVFYVRATYNEEVASASAWFEVKEEFFKSENIAIIFGAIIILLIILIIILRKKKCNKKRKIKTGQSRNKEKTRDLWKYLQGK